MYLLDHLGCNSGESLGRNPAKKKWGDGHQAIRADGIYHENGQQEQINPNHLLRVSVRMASSTPTHSILLQYIHQHNLTCDPEWTFDFADRLLTEVSVAFPVASPSKSLLEEVEQTWSSLDLVTTQTGQEHNERIHPVLQEQWIMSRGPLIFAQRYRDSVKKWKQADLSVSPPDWWGDGLFEFPLVHIMGDYLLQRRNSKTISLQPENLKAIKDGVSFDGQRILKDLIAGGEKPIPIPTPEELSDTTLQLSSSQYQKMKEIKAQREGIIRNCSPLVSSASDLLESDEILSSEASLQRISPPLIPEGYLSLAESQSRNAKEIVSSVINSLQAEVIQESSPTLSNDTWNDIDPCPRPSCTPPSSPPPFEPKEQRKPAVDFLSPSADPNNWDNCESLENPFETVLFSRTEARMSSNSKDRSISFDPRNNLNMASCLLDEHQPVQNSSIPDRSALVEGGIEESSEILNQLVANRGWDDQKFEREIFGSPADAIDLNSRLKRIPVHKPDSPRGVKHEIHEELLPSRLDEFRIRGSEKSRSRNPSGMSRGLQKVEGLRALNIELSWNAYNFLPSTTIEKLTDLDYQPIDQAIDPASDDDLSTKDGYSVISKRFKSEHNPDLNDQPWINLSDFLEQPTSQSESFYSQIDIDGSNREPSTIGKGFVSTEVQSSKRSTSPLITRTDQDSKSRVLSSTESSHDIPDNSSQPTSNNYINESGNEDQIQSDFSIDHSQYLSHTNFYEGGSSSLTEEETILDFHHGLGSVDYSTHLEVPGFYPVWTSSTDR
ncbi:hypothetical protein PSTT_04390 [Puccinia striiformis]|uniref:Uncharacterized protein n=2 Tax=Puccinia striiformis TaxID=27350 RepID=A0A2S4VTD5_9BASI|nr:hypothetical protein PSTT_04390 [Puccinia striiformis]